MAINNNIVLIIYCYNLLPRDRIPSILIEIYFILDPSSVARLVFIIYKFNN